MTLHDNAPELLLDAYRGGEPARDIADRIGCSRFAVLKLLRDARAREIADMPDIAYIPNKSFYRKGANRRFRGPEPEGLLETKGLSNAPPGLPPYLAELYRHPLLTSKGEKFLFKKFNYCKYRASEIRERIDPVRPNGHDTDMVKTLLQEASRVKQRIVTANVRLVPSTVKRMMGTFDEGCFYELVGRGNMILMRAVDVFDVSRGFAFSTYAIVSIKRSIHGREDGRMWTRTDTGTGFDFSGLVDLRPDPSHCDEDRVERMRLKVRELLNACPMFSDREPDIIRAHLGIGEDGEVVEPKTLKKIGDDRGMTKERARQLEARGMRSLRAYVEEHGLTLDSFEEI